MFLKRQIGSEALHRQQMMSGCRRPAKGGCLGLPEFQVIRTLSAAAAELSGGSAAQSKNVNFLGG